jgi:methanogenic corrinoid protein MtbC1
MFNMCELLQKLSECIEFGKVNVMSPYPPQMKGQDGADELTFKALEQGISPQEVLTLGLMPGMEKVGKKFSENKIFVPQMLMSAKAMSTALMHLKPHFLSGAARQKGVFIIGTVSGDLHDIGKNLVGMMVEGSGYKVIDLGVDVNSEKFIAAVKENPGAVVGLSALLTTTMVNMESITKDIKDAVSGTVITIGGAPVNDEFCRKIGADNYSPDPQGVVEFLNKRNT